MGVNITFTDTDLGYRAIKKRLDDLDGSVIEAGLFDPEQAQKGDWLEFGTVDNPARPWLSVAGDIGEQAFGAAMGKAVGAVCDGKSVKAALDPVGELMADTAADVIISRRVEGPDLADSTQDAKGHDVKGLDSGDMISDIQWEVTL